MADAKPKPRDAKPREIKPRAPTLWLIIVFKLLKGTFLLLLALGVYRLAGKDLGDQFESLLHFLKFDPERKFFMDMGNYLETIKPGNVRWIATGAFLYSMFSLVEGVGLIFRISWAGWLAFGESLFFIPIEIYELLRKPGLTLSVILVLNIFIAFYIFKNRERLFKHH